MMKNWLLALLIGFLSLPAPAQQGDPIVFQGRILNQQTGQPLAGVEVRIIGAGSAITNDDGVFRIPLPRNMTSVKVELPSGWAVVIPEAGQAPVPMDHSYLTPFLIKQLQSRIDQLERTVTRLERENKLKQGQIDSLQQTVADSARLWREQLDRLRLSKTAQEDSLRQRIDRLSAALESGAIRDNKRIAYRAVSSELLHFESALKDLRDALPYVQNAFLSPGAMEEFNRQVKKYNAAWDSLYRYRADRIDQVRKYWEQPELTTRTEQVYQLALDRIHRDIVLPARDGITGEMAAYATGQKPRLTAQKQAKKAAVKLLSQLHVPIQELENAIATLNQGLAVGG